MWVPAAALTCCVFAHLQLQYLADDVLDRMSANSVPVGCLVSVDQHLDALGGDLVNGGCLLGNIADPFE